MKILNKLISWLTELEKYGCILAIGAMFLIGSLEVVSRNFFSKSFIWSQELIVVFLVWEVFLAAAYIYNTGSLISVDFLYANVGEKAQKVFDVIIDLVSFVVIIMVIWFGWQFQAGLIPGILAGLLLMVCCFLFVKSGKAVAPTYERASLKDVWSSFKESILAILAPVIIIGGMITGWVTPTEAAILACLYSLLVSALYKELKIKDIPKILLESAMTSANAQFLVSAASMIGWVITFTQAAKMLSGFITGLTSNIVIILILINVYLLIQGCFIDTTSGLILITPVIFPIATMFQINPIQFGIIICYNLILGALTPPMGAGLYLVSSVTETKVERIIPKLIPFFAVHVLILLLITYVPALTTWLPSLFAK